VSCTPHGEAVCVMHLIQTCTLGTPPLIHTFDPLRSTHTNHTSHCCSKHSETPCAMWQQTAQQIRQTQVRSKCETHTRSQKCVGIIHIAAMFACHSTPQASGTMDGRIGSRGSACLSHFGHIILFCPSFFFIQQKLFVGAVEVNSDCHLTAH